MLAMHYTIALPDDFDMDVIRGRIHDKGALLDGFDGLLFKAFLYACRGEDGPRNLYAPFYVWSDPAAMDRFLRGPGYAALSADFGRPAVGLWVVSELMRGEALRQARWATFGAEPGDVATVSLYDPAAWTDDRFTLRRDVPATPRFRVGYVALGEGESWLSRWSPRRFRRRC
jgi:hypothetical protein